MNQHHDVILYSSSRDLDRAERFFCVTVSNHLSQNVDGCERRAACCRHRGLGHTGDGDDLYSNWSHGRKSHLIILSDFALTIYGGMAACWGRGLICGALQVNSSERNVCKHWWIYLSGFAIFHFWGHKHLVESSTVFSKRPRVQEKQRFARFIIHNPAEARRAPSPHRGSSEFSPAQRHLVTRRIEPTTFLLGDDCASSRDMAPKGPRFSFSLQVFSFSVSLRRFSLKILRICFPQAQRSKRVSSLNEDHERHCEVCCDCTKTNNTWRPQSDSW